MRNYKSKFLELILLCKERFPTRNISFTYSRAGDYIIIVDTIEILLSRELLEDMTIEKILKDIIEEAVKKW